MRAARLLPVSFADVPLPDSPAEVPAVIVRAIMVPPLVVPFYLGWRRSVVTPNGVVADPHLSLRVVAAPIARRADKMRPTWLNPFTFPNVSLTDPPTDVPPVVMAYGRSSVVLVMVLARIPMVSGRLLVPG